MKSPVLSNPSVRSLSQEELIQRVWVSGRASDELVAALIAKIDGLQEKVEELEDKLEGGSDVQDRCRVEGFNDAINVLREELDDLEQMHSIDEGLSQQLLALLDEAIETYRPDEREEPDSQGGAERARLMVDGALRTLDYGVLAQALSELARENGVGRVSLDADITRQALHGALRPGAKTQFQTVVRVLAALGLRLSVEPLM